MTHNEVYAEFKKHLMCYFFQVKKWTPNGENSIRLQFKNGREYIFTCIDMGFKFQSADILDKRLKGDKKMKC